MLNIKPLNVLTAEATEALFDAWNTLDGEDFAAWLAENDLAVEVIGTITED